MTRKKAIKLLMSVTLDGYSRAANDLVQRLIAKDIRKPRTNKFCLIFFLALAVLPFPSGMLGPWRGLRPYSLI